MTTETAATPPAELPKLSMADFQTYNHMSVHMNHFHEHFRMEWRALWDGCSPTPKSKPPNARSLINIGLQFASHLTLHHDIEETHIFPVLAKRMDVFKSSGVHKEQHKQIHKGLDELQEYLMQCREGSRDFRRDEVRACMEKWGDVLWTHLDEEVKTLGAENMRKYWSLKEMRQMPM